MPTGRQVSGFDVLGLLYLVIVLVVLFLPVLLGRRAPPGESEADSDGGNGGPPPRPRTPLDGPRGRIPLDDAEQARRRLRESGRLPFRSLVPLRRPSHRPDRRRERI